MEMRLERRPSGSNFKLLAAWPGMGMLAIISIDYLRKKLKAKFLGELETPHNSVTFKNDILKISSFKHRIYQSGDILICIGEAQPLTTPEVYGLAEKIVNFAKENGVVEVYTVAASLGSFMGEPKVFGIVNSRGMLEVLKKYNVEPVEGEGKITGLNGVLLGVAAKKDLNGLCLLGQIRYVDIPQPKTALNVLKCLTNILDVSIDLRGLEEEAVKLDASIQEAIKRFKPSSQEKGLEYIG